MLRILLADDSRFFRTIERQFLQKTPAEVAEAVDSHDLLAQLHKEKPQLLVLAYAMRPLDGAECCRQIKSDPALRDLPIVMVCDQGMPDQIVSAQRAGCDEVLVKPLDRHSFLQAGRRFLSGIREHRQPCFVSVHFDWDGVSQRGRTLDVSSGGVFVESAADIPIGTILSLAFNLPGSGEPCSCQGEVAWHNRRPNPFKPHYPIGFGVRFRNLPKHLAEEFSRMAAR